MPETVRPTDIDDCADCALVGRRSFMKEAALLLAAIATSLGTTPARAAAMSLGAIRPLGRAGDEHTYPLPAEDGATIDHDSEIIVVRFQQKAYGFNLSCPHQHTALKWQAEDHQFQCPRHHSRYTPDGVFVSGRATRGMDRFGIRRDGDNIVIDVAKYYQQDKNTAEWEAAFVTI
ncbi:MAG: Rieske 2Fe-2S domain-containing protein [Gemmatimonadota bacterium]